MKLGDVVNDLHRAGFATAWVRRGGMVELLLVAPLVAGVWIEFDSEHDRGQVVTWERRFGWHDRLMGLKGDLADAVESERRRQLYGYERK